MSPFQPSANALTAIGIAATILSIISTAFCLLVLVAAIWVYSVPETRHTIDRISFRLMIWSMVFGMGYDMCYFLAEPSFNIINPSSVQCKVVMYWQIATMGAVNYFITCIAINLMLSVRFALNPLTLRLERWYIGVSLFIALFVPIVPAALGHFGADPVYDACYFTDPNLKDRLRNFVLDVYLWQTTASIVACVCVVITLTSILKSGRATAKALLYRSPSISGSRDQTMLSLDSTSSIGGCCSRLFRRNTSSTYQLQDQFLSIALRVALYPVVLVITNAVLTAGDLYLSASSPVGNRAEYGLYIVYYILYGGRNILLASIGLFIDPGLPKGVRLAWRLARSKPSPMGAQDEEVDLDFVSALQSIPFRETNGRKSGLERFTTSKNQEFEKSPSIGILGDPLPVAIDTDVIGSKYKICTSAESEVIPAEPVRRTSLPEARAAEDRERIERREENAKAELQELVHRL